MKRLAIIAAVLAALTVLQIPVIALGAQRGNDVNEDAIALYRPQQFDYFFFYDSSVWQLADQASVQGAEAARFSDGEDVVDYTALAAPGVTMVDCVKAAYEQLKGDPAVLEIGPRDETRDHPQIVDYGTGPYLDLAVTKDEGNGAVPLAVNFWCRELVPGQALLLRAEQKPIALATEYREPWIVGYLPTATRFSMYERDPVPVTGATGDLLGTLDPSLDCTAGEFYVVARGGDGGDFVVDPAAFSAYDPSGAELPVQFLGWLYPRLPADEPRQLRPGEVALFKLRTTPQPGATFTLAYAPPESGAPLSLGRSTTGCGAGGAAPVVIDID